MKKSFAKQIGIVPDIHRFVDQFGAEAAVPDGPLNTLRLALEELFTNMVKYSSEGTQDVPIELTRTDDTITAHLVDRGVKPFDVTRAPKVDINRDPKTIKPGGPGIHLTLEMIDEVQYDHIDGDSHITLKMHLEDM